MNSYDKQYQEEENLFGLSYEAFASFLEEHAVPGGQALDLGCGQGRDALLLAQNGYTVTGIDTSQVGIEQMVARANALNLPVKGITADFHDYPIQDKYDAIVLDSILHFGKADRAKELALLTKCAAQLKPQGILFIFVHRSKKKEKELHKWLSEVGSNFAMLQDGPIDYTYEEKSSGFRSVFTYYMFFVQRLH